MQTHKFKFNQDGVFYQYYLRTLEFSRKETSKSEIVYFCQMIVIYIIMITSIVNLSLQNGSTELWISLLSSAIGYVLPNPSMKPNKL